LGQLDAQPSHFLLFLQIKLVPAFSEEDREMFRSAFGMFDLDGNGVMCAKELGTLLRALGQNPTNDELEELLIVSIIYKS
jgi:Ca2+-binding EF-hand superfamily protein